jgi:hypothetical protein
MRHRMVQSRARNALAVLIFLPILALLRSAHTHCAAATAFPCADGMEYRSETYSDLETLIGEDEGGVGGGELGVRHCWWNRAVSCLGRYRSVRIRASTQRICWSSEEEVFEDSRTELLWLVKFDRWPAVQVRRAWQARVMHACGLVCDFTFDGILLSIVDIFFLVGLFWMLCAS